MKEYQIRLLKSKMCLVGYTLYNFCKECGTSKQNLYNKMSGKRDFKLKELKIMKSTLNLNAEEMEKIFFE